MRVLLIDSRNGHMSFGNQFAYFFDITPDIDEEKLREINEHQLPAAARIGTSICQFIYDAEYLHGFVIKTISDGRLKDYAGVEALRYKVIIGNY